MAHCLTNLGEAHSRHGDHSESLEHLTRARDFCSDLPFERVQCAENFADTHHRLQQLDEAEKWAVLALNERRQSGAYLGYSLYIFGKILISKAEYDKAIKSLEEGLECAKIYGDQQNTADTLLELGWVYMKMGKKIDANRSFSRALIDYANLEGVVEEEKIVCQYYLDKLDDPSRLPTLEEEAALRITWHEEDVPGYNSVISTTV
ncbi:hypothetical protein C8J56DRAFT_1068087 [Mycena floridula]|nr:hypothetical protein C8J56DRAFT_1068087 [Mycena floridula]